MHQVRKVEAELKEKMESLATKVLETHCGNAMDDLLKLAGAYTVLHTAINLWEADMHGHSGPAVRPAPTLHGK